MNCFSLPGPDFVGQRFIMCSIIKIRITGMINFESSNG